MRAPLIGPLRSPYDEAPARLLTRPIPAADPWTGLVTNKLELISRGDIVTGVHARPAAAEVGARAGEPAALILLHDAGSHASGPEWRPVARWIARGPHAIAIDLPLHGLRASAKLTERLIGALASLDRGVPLDRNGEVLADEALRQARCDVARTLDGLLALGAIDPKRVGLVGIGLGARVAEALLEDDGRPSAAVLVRTRPAPGGPPGESSGTTEVLRLDVASGKSDWAADAERFLAARLGF